MAWRYAVTSLCQLYYVNWTLSCSALESRCCFVLSCSSVSPGRWFSGPDFTDLSNTIIMTISLGECIYRFQFIACRQALIYSVSELTCVFRREYPSAYYYRTQVNNSLVEYLESSCLFFILTMIVGLIYQIFSCLTSNYTHLNRLSAVLSMLDLTEETASSVLIINTLLSFSSQRKRNYLLFDGAYYVIFHQMNDICYEHSYIWVSVIVSVGACNLLIIFLVHLP